MAAGVYDHTNVRINHIDNLRLDENFDSIEGVTTEEVVNELL